MSAGLIESLVNTRLAERDKLAADIEAAMRSQLAIDPVPNPALSKEEVERVMVPYVAWCQTNRIHSVAPFPAKAAALALFLQEAQLPIESLVDVLKIISLVHLSQNLADPTASYLVTAVMTKKMAIDPPRSWAKETWDMFRSLPYAAQKQIVLRDRQATTEVKRAQNAEQRAKKEMIALRESENEAA